MIEINGLKMYDSDELAELLGVKKSRVYQLRRRGLIRSVYLDGKKLYTSEQSVMDYLNGLTLPKREDEKGNQVTKSPSNKVTK